MSSQSGNFVTGISFGCSNLLGDKTPQQGRALLDAAFDAGIRSFDVARVYNFGDAERLVGEFAASRRQDLTITTKFGLTPNASVAKMGSIVNVVRRLMRSSNFIRKLVRRNVSKMVQQGNFSVEAAQLSLEASLRALNTDFIDVYLLHEPALADCTPAIFEFLERSCQQGKIRTFGVGVAYHRVPQIAQTAPRFLAVTQFESSPVHENRQNFESIRPLDTKLVITHGSFSGTGFFRDAIAAGAPIVRAWSDRVGFDLAAEGILHAALLRCALRRNPGGRVIFRASTPARITQNMRALDTAFSEAQLDALESLCRETAAL